MVVEGSEARGLGGRGWWGTTESWGRITRGDDIVGGDDGAGILSRKEEKEIWTAESIQK